MSLTGGKIGLLTRGTILKYNNDGTVQVAIDIDSSTQGTTKRVPMPLAYAGPSGEFIGGYPSRGTSVLLSQAQGEWFISKIIPTNGVFVNSNTFNLGGFSQNLMSELKEGRILIQTRPNDVGIINRILLDFKDGIKSGSQTQYSHEDPKRSIISTNFNTQLRFSSSHREIIGIVKRDLKENNVRNITGSILNSHEYDDSLFTIGMDPSVSASTKTSGSFVRNLPLIEKKEIIYEFQNLSQHLSFLNDNDEAERYLNNTPNLSSDILRRESRAEGFGLSLAYPNHLIEKIEGTGVDIYGNIIDLNRNILPIGKTKDNSFIKNPDNVDAFKRIRSLHRKSLAYHFEINARKSTRNEEAGIDEVFQVPDVLSKNDFARNRSRFFIDIDKEGQFKINIPSSSETGNIPLLTRYENASVILSAQGSIDNPNKFIRESNNQDIFLENFASNPSIKLNSGFEDSDGFEAPIDRFTESSIKYGTAYHDILKTASQFQDSGRDNLINYFDEDEIYLNRSVEPIEKVINDTIIVSGPGSNAGGRSGSINLDGFISVNIGANTIDRQSMWLDYAGGVVSNIGRDRFGRSYVASFDGDILMQVGGPGLPSTADSRFQDEPAGNRSGTFDIRILRSDGQLTVIRVDDKGLFIATPGRMEIASEQDMIFRSNANILFEGKEIGFYPENGQMRRIKRNGVPEI